MEVVGEAADGREALSLVRHFFQPDVVLMDITMPRMTGLMPRARCADGHHATRVLVLTMHGTDEYFSPLAECRRASVYVLKDAKSHLTW